MIWCITFCYFYVITCRFRSKYTVYFVWLVRRFTVSNSFQEKLVSESFKSVCVYECFEIRSNFIKSNKVSCVLSEWFFACRSLVTIYFRSYELNKRCDTKEIQIAQERSINCKLFYFKRMNFTSKRMNFFSYVINAIETKKKANGNNSNTRVGQWDFQKFMRIYIDVLFILIEWKYVLLILFYLDTKCVNI